MKKITVFPQYYFMAFFASVLFCDHSEVNASEYVLEDYSNFAVGMIVKYRDVNCDPSLNSECSDLALTNIDDAKALTQVLNQKYNLNLLYERRMSGNAHVLNFDEPKRLADSRVIAEVLVSDEAIVYAIPNQMSATPLAIPNDPLFSSQWNFFEELGGINVESAWDYTHGEGVVVAVLDLSFSLHEDIINNLLPGYDFDSLDLVYGDIDPGRDSDPFVEVGGHGTPVSGIISAEANNNIAAGGVAWGAKVVPIVIGSRADNIDALYWAAGFPVEGVPDNANPAQVINMSWVLASVDRLSCGQDFQDAIDAVRSVGVTPVAGAGNSGGEVFGGMLPQGCEGVIVVAATDGRGQLAYYSNFGSLVDIAAPGGDFKFREKGVFSIHGISDTFSDHEGTSFASPHVTGVVALAYGIKPDITPSEVEDLLISTARSFPLGACIRDILEAGTDNLLGTEEVSCGSGIVDAGAVVQFLIGELELQPELDTDNDGVSDYLEFVLQLNPFANEDDDGDGIPNDWESFHGLNPADALDAEQDFDSDGFSNRAEYENGTDPHTADLAWLIPVLYLLLN